MVAERLFVSKHTIESHIENDLRRIIFQSLNYWKKTLHEGWIGRYDQECLES